MVKVFLEIGSLHPHKLDFLHDRTFGNPCKRMIKHLGHLVVDLFEVVAQCATKALTLDLIAGHE